MLMAVSEPERECFLQKGKEKERKTKIRGSEQLFQAQDNCNIKSHSKQTSICVENHLASRLMGPISQTEQGKIWFDLPQNLDGSTWLKVGREAVRMDTLKEIGTQTNNFQKTVQPASGQKISQKQTSFEWTKR